MVRKLNNNNNNKENNKIGKKVYINADVSSFAI